MAVPAFTEHISDVQHMSHAAARLDHHEVDVRLAALRVLAALGERTAPHAASIAAMLEDDDPAVQNAAAFALGALGEAAAPHIAALVAIVRNMIFMNQGLGIGCYYIDAGQGIISLEALGSLVTTVPEVAQYASDVYDYCQVFRDGVLEDASHAVLRAFERAGFWERHGPGSPDREVLDIWSSGGSDNVPLVGCCLALEELWAFPEPESFRAGSTNQVELPGIVFSRKHHTVEPSSSVSQVTGIVTPGPSPTAPEERIVMIHLCGALGDSTYVPPQLGELDALTELDLSGNQLTSIPAEFGRLSSLMVLNLDGNQLLSLPATLGQLTNLEVLRLTHNQLQSIPAKLGRLGSLMELRLDRNNLTSIPVEIGNLHSLVSLDLSGNQLSSVPEEIGDLSSLRWLDLSGNRLTSLPTALGRLTSLTRLDLENNQLTDLPTELGALSSLLVLYLGKNRLTMNMPAAWKIGGALERSGMYGRRSEGCRIFRDFASGQDPRQVRHILSSGPSCPDPP